MGPPGAPFRLGPRAKCPSCPPPVGGPAYVDVWGTWMHSFCLLKIKALLLKVCRTCTPGPTTWIKMFYKYVCKVAKRKLNP